VCATQAKSQEKFKIPSFSPPPKMRALFFPSFRVNPSIKVDVEEKRKTEKKVR